MNQTSILSRAIGAIAALAVTAAFVAVGAKDSSHTDAFGKTAHHIVVDNLPGGAAGRTHAASPQG